MKAQDRISAASRDQRIRSMVTSEKGTTASLLIKPASDEIVAVAESEEALKQWLANQQYDADHRTNMEKFAHEFERFGFEVPSCGTLESPVLTPGVGAVTALAGAYVLILTNTGFGTPLNLPSCLLLGLGLPTGTLLASTTTGSIATTFNVTR